MKTLTVTTQTTSYPVYIGVALLSQLTQLLKPLPAYQSSADILLISNETVYPLYGAQVVRSLENGGKRVHSFLLPDGEQYKTWDSAGEILAFALEKQLSRKTLLVALGGGVVGDIAGFVASIYLRGIPFVQIPTTLLAQVDSSVGGKVAVNHQLGKNMIGSFYHPEAVIGDLDTLSSLPEREWISGLAEVVKYGVLWDADFFAFLASKQQAVERRDPTVLAGIIYRCCEIKAEVVGEDETEQGLRAVLNLGHTAGHAIERATNYCQYSHGEAVAIGMVVAVKLACSYGMLSSTEADTIQSVLADYRMPLTLPDKPVETILEGLRFDKKAVGFNVTFILPTKIGQVEIVPAVDMEQVKAVLLTMYNKE